MERILWVLLVVTIVWAVAMAFEAAGFDKSKASGLIGRFDSPIVMLELADSQPQFVAILNQGDDEKNIKIMQINTHMDFVFIVLYCLTLVFLAAVCSSTSALTKIVAGTVTATGVLDYWENFRLLAQFRMLKSGLAIATPLPRPVSLAKWGMFAMDLSLVGFALLQARNHIGTHALPAMVFFVFLAAVCATVGLLRNRFIGTSVVCLFPALLIAACIWKPWP